MCRGGHGRGHSLVYLSNHLERDDGRYSGVSLHLLHSVCMRLTCFFVNAADMKKMFLLLQGQELTCYYINQIWFMLYCVPWHEMKWHEILFTPYPILLSAQNSILLHVRLFVKKNIYFTNMRYYKWATGHCVMVRLILASGSPIITNNSCLDGCFSSQEPLTGLFPDITYW